MAESLRYVVGTLIFLVVPLVCGLAMMSGGVGMFRKGGRGRLVGPVFFGLGLVVTIGSLALWLGDASSFD